MKKTKMLLLLSCLFIGQVFLDAQAVKNTLESHYKFDYSRALYNEEATRINNFKAFEWLAATVKENDNVLIYFSGHGEYNRRLDAGFWVPVDAEAASFSELVPNVDIHLFMLGIRSKHTLLISDAAFTGDFMRSSVIHKEFNDTPEYYEEVYKLPSRKALTSGGIEPVIESVTEGHSVFTFYIIKALANNEKKYFDATELFNQIEVPISNNSTLEPQFHPLKNTGDAGGQFVFIRKEE